MEIQEQRHGAVTVLKPQGPLCQADAEMFGKKLQEMLGRSLGRLVVDASAIAYVDSQGLEAMVQATDELAQSGRALHLCGAGDTLREVLDLTGLIERFELYEDVNAAVRSFL
ncbi:MAG: STAS domain-containing protein [Phycisphaerales bacterium]|nr:STAS domain-containing protein [Phycisphaerales bacterium]